ncbi:MAG: hypothetical protein H7346_27960 [Burkholderiaceae bacterium]|nr:hypothetical protein [Burkholderiaceae bacterium]
MKYLLVLAIVLIGLWLWRGNRRVPPPPDARAAQPQLQDMIGCAVCELHVPRADATIGRSGALYCSTDHRRRAEG